MLSYAEACCLPFLPFSDDLKCRGQKRKCRQKNEQKREKWVESEEEEKTCAVAGQGHGRGDDPVQGEQYADGTCN